MFDVTDADSVRAAVEHIEVDGPIDILVNNAGMQIRVPLHSIALRCKHPERDCNERQQSNQPSHLAGHHPRHHSLCRSDRHAGRQQ
ncbi:SDR family NAD(P)-dependent oxidoreductase [Limnohabitans sp. DM1]|uniref:SDR family NAD(P)-dependent oxidoreductase n=1 Tax=Limnohabitans sp. DM1 TaxID=1597955 RepID=UPI00350F6136